MSGSVHAGVEINEQVTHLLASKATGKGRHHSPARKHRTLNILIRSGQSAWQNRLIKQSVQVGRDLFQPQIIVFMAMRTARIVKVLPFRLFWSQCCFAVTTRNSERSTCNEEAQDFGPEEK